MATCNRCGGKFDWAQDADGGWALLVPLGEDADMDRTFVDEDGVLRADHRETCPAGGGKIVRVTRLEKRVPAGDVIAKGRGKGRRAA